MPLYLKKIVQHYCSNCKMIRTMQIVSLEMDLNIYWLKCKKCHGSIMIKQSELLKKEIRNLNNRVISPENNHQIEEQVQEYKPVDTYKLGQALYHSGFDDKGIVTAVKPGTGGFDKIVVKFDNLGKKMLIHGISKDDSK